MNTPVQITYRHMDPSPALTQLIDQQVQKLEEFSDHILECRVVVDEPHQHHHQGRHFRVQVTAMVKGAELVAGRDPEQATFREDPYQVVHDSFRAIRRQLQDHVQIMRRDVKAHTAEPSPR